MHEADERLYDLVADERRRRKNENERDDDERRLPKLMLARPAYALGLRRNAAEILFRLLEDVHLLLRFVGRVGGNRTPIGGFGDRCTAIVLLPY